MSRTQKVAGYLLVVLLGVIGCGQGPAAGPAKPPADAAKVQKLEEDLRAAAAARDALRQKLAATEDRQSALQKQLAAAAGERDGLKVEVKARTTERDSLQLQYDTFRKSIKDLVGQAESSLTAPPPALVGAR